MCCVHVLCTLYLICMQNDIHLLGHDLPGGTMGTFDSAQAPIFNLHHAYIDYQWWRYLRTSAENRAAAMKFHKLRAPDPMLATDSKSWPKLPGTQPGGIKASELLDNTRLGETQRLWFVVYKLIFVFTWTLENLPCLPRLLTV